MNEPDTEPQRRFPIGAELLRGGAHVRVWAPTRSSVEVVLCDENDVPQRAERLKRDAQGYHGGAVRFLGPGSRYGFRLDGDERLYPDPASRFQPKGPHGMSELVDPARFDWNDSGFPGLGPRGLVLYELHVGTFTREGTFRAAMNELAELQALGVTAIELMPVADFSGALRLGLRRSEPVGPEPQLRRARRPARVRRSRSPARARGDPRRARPRTDLGRAQVLAADRARAIRCAAVQYDVPRPRMIADDRGWSTARDSAQSQDRDRVRAERDCNAVRLNARLARRRDVRR